MDSHHENQPYYPYANLGSAKARQDLENCVSGFFTRALELRSAYLANLAKRKEVFETVKQKPENERAEYILSNLNVEYEIPPFRQQIVAPAGLGKTTSVIKNLDRCRGFTVWFIVPTTDLAKEVVEKIRKDAPQVNVILYEGRNIETCARHEIAQFMGSKGFNVQSGLCGKDDDENASNTKKDKTDVRCVHYETCPYQVQRQMMKELESVDEKSPARVIVMTHGYLTANCGAPKPDLVIVDESHWQSFLSITSEQGKGGKPDLTFAEIRNAGEEDVEEHAAYVEFVNALISSMQKSPFSFLRLLSKQKQASVEKALTHIKVVIFKHSRPEILPSYDDDEIRSIASDFKLLRLQLIVEMLEALRYELEKKKGVTAVTYNPQNDTVRVHRILQNMIPREVPVLLIDASADLEINQRIWGHHLESFEIRVERNAEIIQVQQHTFSKSSLGIVYSENANWKPKESAVKKLEDLILFVNNIADQTNGCVFFAASKRIKDTIQDKLANNVVTGHFGALRGKNTYENCEIAIIVGREEPNYLMVEGLARALLSRHEKGTIMLSQDYARKTRNIRLKNGSVRSEIVRVHVNSFVQSVLEQIREKEIEQALDRLRLMNDNIAPKKIYLLTSIVIDATIEETQTWEELQRATKMDTAIKYALTKAKAFPLGDRDILVASPLGLWSTQNAVGSYITRHGGVNWVGSLIISYIKTDPLYLVEYRRPKQKKASTAIVSANEPNPKAALEKVIGYSVSYFKIVDHINLMETQDNDLPDDPPD